MQRVWGKNSNPFVFVEKRYICKKIDSMNKKAIIQQIHDRFEFDLLDAVNQRSMRAHYLNYKPGTIPEDVFFKMLEHYKMYYPTNNFVTERQVREICIKYGLVVGPLGLFSAHIPKRNRVDMQRFKLADIDRSYYDEKFLSRFLQSLIGDIEVELSQRSAHDCPFIRLETGFFERSFEDEGEVIPVGDGFVLIAQGKEGVFMLCAKANVHESEWLIYLGEVSIYSGHVKIDWRVSADFIRDIPGFRTSGVEYGMRRFCRVRLQFDMNYLSGMNHINMQHNISQMIVAPGTMFEKYKESLEVKHGYRLRFKPTPIESFSLFSRTILPVDDPIVLQPVPGGYLVVTKWGLESMIPEIVNDNQN